MQRIEERRIQTALPEESYEEALYVCGMYGMTMKSFAAEAIVEKAQRCREKLEMHRPNQKVLRLTPKAVEQVEYFLEHPEIFADAVSQLKKAAEDVRILPVPDGEQL